jgi:hypothetical protein
VEIETRIRENEERKLEGLRRDLEARYRDKEQEAQRSETARANESIAKEKAQAQTLVAAANNERDAILADARRAAELSDQDRKKAVDAANATGDARVAAIVKERDTARAQLLDFEDHAKTNLDEAVCRALASASAREALLVSERDAAKSEAAEIRERSQTENAKQIEEAVKNARLALEADYEKKDANRAAESGRERDSMLKKITDLQRQLEHKNATELGDGAELDLYEALREAFPGDDIKRIPKGERGADIRHKILHRGEVAGTILFDSKNRKAWQNAFATKLRSDQVEEGAECAVLSTTVFPRGKRDLCIESHVVVVRPTSAVQLAQLLRGQIIASHVAGLTNEQRAEKRETLFKFIGSDAYRQQVAEVARIADQLLKLDAEESNEHQRTWKKRGALVRQQQRALIAVDKEISSIMEGK